MAGFGVESLSSVVGMDPVARFQQARQLLEDSQPREALDLLVPALHEEPRSVSLRTLLAWAYFLTAQLRHAEAELRVLVEDAPTDVWARFALGRTLERQNKLAEALPHLRMAAVMSGDPEHEVAVLRVERLLLTQTSG